MKILVVHALRSDSRITTIDHALFPGRHWTGAEVHFKNVFGPPATSIEETTFDLGIVTYEVLGCRNFPYWPLVKAEVTRLLQKCALRVMFPQDDFVNSAALEDFAHECQIHHIFCSTPQDVHILYPNCIGSKIQIHPVMNGYWESTIHESSRPIVSEFSARRYDVAQRVSKVSAVLGHEARKKSQLAERFRFPLTRSGFSCDIATHSRSMLSGRDWHDFLRQSRFTIGCLAGASRVDRSGSRTMRSIRLATLAPRLPWEIHYKLFRVSSLPAGNFTSVGPRVIESAAMGVCQILEEDKYFAGFEPWTHYLPIDLGMRSVNDVLTVMRDHEYCCEVASNAYTFLIESGKYTYAHFCTELRRILFPSEKMQNGIVSIVDGDQESSRTLLKPSLRSSLSAIEGRLVPWESASRWLADSNNNQQRR